MMGRWYLIRTVWQQSFSLPGHGHFGCALPEQIPMNNNDISSSQRTNRKSQDTTASRRATTSPSRVLASWHWQRPDRPISSDRIIAILRPAPSKPIKFGRSNNITISSQTLLENRPITKMSQKFNIQQINSLRGVMKEARASLMRNSDFDDNLDFILEPIRLAYVDGAFKYSQRMKQYQMENKIKSNEYENALQLTLPLIIGYGEDRYALVIKNWMLIQSVAKDTEIYDKLWKNTSSNAANNVSRMKSWWPPKPFSTKHVSESAHSRGSFRVCRKCSTRAPG
jgi:hypothetical protein